MSTNSAITWRNPEGLYEYRYHHSDGYLTGVGATLLKSFNSKKDVSALFGLKKHLSTINWSQDEYLKNPNDKTQWPNDHRQHQQISEQHVVYYAKEDISKPAKNKNLFFKKYSEGGFLYFFDATEENPQWLCSVACDKKLNPEWIPLKEAIALMFVVKQMDSSHTDPSEITTLAQQANLLIESVQNSPAWDNFVSSTIENSDVMLAIEQKKTTEAKLTQIITEAGSDNTRKPKI